MAWSIWQLWKGLSVNLLPSNRWGATPRMLCPMELCEGIQICTGQYSDHHPHYIHFYECQHHRDYPVAVGDFRFEIEMLLFVKAEHRVTCAGVNVGYASAPEERGAFSPS